MWVNKEAETKPEILEKARNLFHSMEEGRESSLNTWQMFRDLSVKEFKKSYKRLNIEFDEYHGESMYPLSKCSEILELMLNKNLLRTTEDGRKVYDNKRNDTHREVTVVKSDGSSLYITRDIAAAIDRYKKYKFDRMYYVVDNGQIDYFRNLFSILSDMGYNWNRSLEHVNFGRILGMSTRKGRVIFFDDALNEARDLALEKQKLSKCKV